MTQIYRTLGKRVLDLAIVMPVLVLLSPVFALIALSVRLTMGPPVLFRQKRPGLCGRPFTLFKFRTMGDLRDIKGDLLPDSERLTPLGKFLRRASLDELPELFNVLSGDMSLVGPRPLLLQYLDRYTAEQARRHNVRPGITGVAQLSGRQTIPFSHRLDLDIWYVDHCSFLLDLRILLRTFPSVLAMGGVIPGQDVSVVDDLGLYREEEGLHIVTGVEKHDPPRR